MRNTKPATAPAETLAANLARQAIGEASARLGFAEVVRIVDVPRSTLASFLVNACREGTSALIVARVSRLSPSELAKAS
jgi:hypothetical protein